MICARRGSARVLGCTTTIPKLAHGHDVRPEYGVDTRLVSRAAALEPREHVPVHAKRNGLLRHGVHHDGVGPEVAREIGEFGRGSTANLSLRGSAQFGEVRATTGRAFSGD
jgi:hypothetical protein